MNDWMGGIALFIFGVILSGILTERAYWDEITFARAHIVHVCEGREHRIEKDGGIYILYCQDRDDNWIKQTIRMEIKR